MTDDDRLADLRRQASNSPAEVDLVQLCDALEGEYEVQRAAKEIVRTLIEELDGDQVRALAERCFQYLDEEPGKRRAGDILRKLDSGTPTVVWVGEVGKVISEKRRIR